MKKKRLVVAGASGLVGRAALERFALREDWEVIGVSRRKPIGLPPRARQISLDLLDRDVCAKALRDIGDVEYLIYAAVNERNDDMCGGWSDKPQIDKNDAMFANILDPLASSPSFRHVGIVHGGKAYGVHLPNMKLPTPLYEDLPRHPGDNFYYRHEDHVKRAQAGASWHWTVLRACHTYGVSVGGNLDAFYVLVVFAALRKEAGQDLPMPEGYSSMGQPTDSDLIAEALEWAMDTPAARNDIFNIHNGDVFANYDLLPIVASCLGMKMGTARRYDINAEIDDLANLWPGMVEKYKLVVPKDINALLGNSRQIAGSWTADMPPEKQLVSGVESTIKIRQAGFQTCVDTRAMIAKWVRRMQELKMIP